MKLDVVNAVLLCSSRVQFLLHLTRNFSLFAEQVAVCGNVFTPKSRRRCLESLPWSSVEVSWTKWWLLESCKTSFWACSKGNVSFFAIFLSSFYVLSFITSQRLKLVYIYPFFFFWVECSQIISVEGYCADHLAFACWKLFFRNLIFFQKRKKLFAISVAHLTFDDVWPICRKQQCVHSQL